MSLRKLTPAVTRAVSLITRPASLKHSHPPIRSLSVGTTEDFDPDDGVSVPFGDHEHQERLEQKMGACQTWVYDLAGTKRHLLHLNPDIYGLPPRTQLLSPIVLRQLKHKLQDEPYGSEENNFIEFDRLADRLYQDRPHLKPWIKQGVAWHQQTFTKPTPIQYGSTSHMPVPHYHGNVPKKLRDVGVRVLLSLKHRYDKLLIIDDLSSTERYIEPAEFRETLDNLGMSSALMITGKDIAPHFSSSSWGRRDPFPVRFPGTQRLWKTACNTAGCELREVAGLDVWSALLYDTLILDLSAVHKIEDQINTSKFSTPNINLRECLESVETEGALGASPERHKVVRLINLDNL